MLSASIVRFRTGLQRTFFPDPPPRQRITVRRILIFGRLGALAVVILLARMWPSHPLNTIWAEDGAIFLRDAMKENFLRAATTPYSGYLQLTSRLVAFPVARLPVSWFAPLMAISGAVIVSGCALIVWAASGAHITDPCLRASLAALVVLLPIVGVETLDNVTNSIWFLFFSAFWILLWHPTTIIRALGAATILLLAVLSTAGTILLFPLWLLRLIATRDRRDSVIVASYAIGVTVQLAPSWGVRNERGENLTPFATAIEAVVDRPAWHWSLVTAYVQRIVGGAATGQRITPYLWVHFEWPFVIALAIALTAFIVWTVTMSQGPARVLVPFIVATSLGIFLFEGYQRWSPNGRTFLWPNGQALSVGIWDDQHYFVVPTLLLFSAIFIALDSRPKSISLHAWRWVQIGTAVLVLFVALLSFNASDAQLRGSTTWSRSLSNAQSQCVRRHSESMSIVISPTNTGSSWTIPLSCIRLR